MLLGLPLVEMLGVVNKIGCLRCTNQMRGKGCELENTLSVFCVNQEMSFFFFFIRQKDVNWTPFFGGKNHQFERHLSIFNVFFWVCQWDMAPWPHGELGGNQPNSTYRGFEALSDLNNQVGGCDSMAA